MTQWPHDDPASLAAFYGDPNTGAPGRQLVTVAPPFKMYYDGKPVPHITFHRKAASALSAALNEIWDHYGRDQATLDKLGISHFSGTYNPRKIRGSATRWSNHAYGAAIDINAEKNGFNTGHGTMPQPVVDAFKRQGALWGGDYHGRTDPMHFEFCSRNAAPVGFMPQTDADSASDVVEDETAQDTPDTKAPWYRKVWSWVTGGSLASIGGLGGGWFAGVDHFTISLLVGAALVVFLVVWFTQKGKGW